MAAFQRWLVRGVRLYVYIRVYMCVYKPNLGVQRCNHTLHNAVARSPTCKPTFSTNYFPSLLISTFLTLWLANCVCRLHGLVTNSNSPERENNFRSSRMTSRGLLLVCHITEALTIMGTIGKVILGDLKHKIQCPLLGRSQEVDSY